MRLSCIYIWPFSSWPFDWITFTVLFGHKSELYKAECKHCATHRNRFYYRKIFYCNVVACQHKTGQGFSGFVPPFSSRAATNDYFDNRLIDDY